MGEELNKESVFDQKAYIQIRLHNLLSQIDFLNINPMGETYQGVYNYQIIFRHLTSCFATISAKLKLQEKEDMKNKINDISKKVYSQLKTKNGGKVLVNFTLFQEIMEDLINFRLYIEEMMDSHGFNPSKADLGRAVLDF